MPDNRNDKQPDGAERATSIIDEQFKHLPPPGDVTVNEALINAPVESADADSTRTAERDEKQINPFTRAIHGYMDTMSTVKDNKDAVLSSLDDMLDNAIGDGETWYGRIVRDMIKGVVTVVHPLFMITQYSQIVGQQSTLQPLLRDVRGTLPDVMQAFQGRYRGALDDDGLYRILSSYGYNDEYITALKSAFEVLPSAQDVISFAVREVYNPDIVRQFAMDTGLDRIESQARPDVERTGMQWDEFKKYWRAHWRLPGVNQAFEMLHRQEIDTDTLRVILRAADIMPGFIDPLINISYRPLTRVDVRRMHKLGVLDLYGDDKSVYKAYRDIGYNDENARLMTEFTAQYNAPDEDGERELTKSDIIGAYDDYLITRTDAETMLRTIGYDDDDAEFLLDRAEFSRERDIIKQQLAAWRKAYVNGVYTREELYAKMDGLNLPADYRDALVERWTIDREATAERPTKAEILGFFRAGIITKTEAVNELSIMGYDGKYIDWYIQAAERKMSNA